MNKVLVILIPFVMMGVLFIGGLGIYNGLVSAQEEAKTAWVLVENQYQRRADVIPNLVEAFNREFHFLLIYFRDCFTPH
ncbi:MAG: LemA family protein [Deltaproteobacteria bacterium]|nr:LemA family protein [Deltaproteobacteria bacterium]